MKRNKENFSHLGTGVLSRERQLLMHIRMTFKAVIRSVILLLIFLVATDNHLKAQTDFTKIKVDQLSDAQIKSMMQRVGDMG
ncbi:MAG TPA: hypothetical protein VL943_14240, partial [Niabella sp.]|nr:hypothetical protein [Niabella sp.]